MQKTDKLGSCYPAIGECYFLDVSPAYNNC